MVRDAHRDSGLISVDNFPAGAVRVDFIQKTQDAQEPLHPVMKVVHGSIGDPLGKPLTGKVGMAHQHQVIHCPGGGDVEKSPSFGNLLILLSFFDDPLSSLLVESKESISSSVRKFPKSLKISFLVI